jgi:predicted adenine nucleotide alpha hydrolase (AANH) superfamily ATPase
MKKNYSAETEKILAELKQRPRLLLHSCCAPCSSYVLECLTKRFDVTVFFYNPNIYPEKEYETRLYWQKHLISTLYPDVRLVGTEYRDGEFLSAASGLETEPEGGARCERCFELRIDETAKTAAESGFPWFCSTLSVSPHKNAELINAVGQAASEKYGVMWLPSDFKKRGGYLRSVSLSKELRLYRQKYCGCVFGKNIVEL